MRVDTNSTTRRHCAIVDGGRQGVVLAAATSNGGRPKRTRSTIKSRGR